MPVSPGDKVVNLIQTPTIPPCLNLSSAGPSQASPYGLQRGARSLLLLCPSPLFACDGDGE
jgi:hypothetical protein